MGDGKSKGRVLEREEMEGRGKNDKVMRLKYENLKTVSQQGECCLVCQT